MVALRSFDTFRDSYEQVLLAISSLTNIEDPGGGVFLGIRSEGPPPGSPNPDPISDKKKPFIFHAVLRPGF